MSFNPDGSFDCINRYLPMPYTWEPTDKDNKKLAPHMWLVEEDHHFGAVKILEAMLVMVPGLREAIHEIAAMQLWPRRAA